MSVVLSILTRSTLCRIFRSKFLVPSKADLRRPTLAKSPTEGPFDENIYLCGNYLGLQPKALSNYINIFLTQ